MYFTLEDCETKKEDFFNRYILNPFISRPDQSEAVSGQSATIQGPNALFEAVLRKGKVE